VVICESGNLPECWYRKKISRSRGIDRTVYVSADSSGHLFLVCKHPVFKNSQMEHLHTNSEIVKQHIYPLILHNYQDDMK